VIDERFTAPNGVRLESFRPQHALAATVRVHPKPEKPRHLRLQSESRSLAARCQKIVASREPS
jgi:hypothetical protein